MQADRASGLQMYSQGIVAKDKPFGTDIIEVTPIEEFSGVKGRLADASITSNTSMKDASGNSIKGNVKGGFTIKAKWLPGDTGGNRQTAPDVIEGETVDIYRFADTQDYYWKPSFREPTLRRREHVVYTYSNLPSGHAAYDLDTSYWAVVSTIKKIVALHTSSNDGEPFSYDAKFDTKSGFFIITDDIGNSIEINSKSKTITIKTSEGAVATLEKSKISLKAPDGVSIDGGSSVSNKASEISNESSSFSVDSSDTTLGSSALKINTDSMSINGKESLPNVMNLDQLYADVEENRQRIIRIEQHLGLMWP